MNLFYPHTWRVLAGVMLAIFTLSFLFLFLPYASLVYEKHTVLNEQSEQIALMGNWQERLSGLEEKQGLLQEGMEAMVINLADENEFSKVVEEIFSYAGSGAVTIRKIQPLSEEKEEKYLKRNIRLQAEGQYHGIVRFINKVEQGNYLIIVRAINMKKEPGTQTVTATIDLEITLMKRVG